MVNKKYKRLLGYNRIGGIGIMNLFDYSLFIGKNIGDIPARGFYSGIILPDFMQWDEKHPGQISGATFRSFMLTLDSMDQAIMKDPPSSVLFAQTNYAVLVNDQPYDFTISQNISSVPNPLRPNEIISIGRTQLTFNEIPREAKIEIHVRIGTDVIRYYQERLNDRLQSLPKNENFWSNFEHAIVRLMRYSLDRVQNFKLVKQILPRDTAAQFKQWMYNDLKNKITGAVFLKGKTAGGNVPQDTILGYTIHAEDELLETTMQSTDTEESIIFREPVSTNTRISITWRDPLTGHMLRHMYIPDLSVVESWNYINPDTQEMGILISHAKNLQYQLLFEGKPIEIIPTTVGNKDFIPIDITAPSYSGGTFILQHMDRGKWKEIGLQEIQERDPRVVNWKFSHPETQEIGILVNGNPQWKYQLSANNSTQLIERMTTIGRREIFIPKQVNLYKEGLLVTLQYDDGTGWKNIDSYTVPKKDDTPSSEEQLKVLDWRYNNWNTSGRTGVLFVSEIPDATYFIARGNKKISDIPIPLDSDQIFLPIDQYPPAGETIKLVYGTPPNFKVYSQIYTIPKSEEEIRPPKVLNWAYQDETNHQQGVLVEGELHTQYQLLANNQPINNMTIIPISESQSLLSLPVSLDSDVYAGTSFTLQYKKGDTWENVASYIGKGTTAIQTPPTVVNWTYENKQTNQKGILVTGSPFIQYQVAENGQFNPPPEISIVENQVFIPLEPYPVAGVVLSLYYLKGTDWMPFDSYTIPEQEQVVSASILNWHYTYQGQKGLLIDNVNKNKTYRIQRVDDQESHFSLIDPNSIQMVNDKQWFIPITSDMKPGVRMSVYEGNLLIGQYTAVEEPSIPTTPRVADWHYTYNNESGILIQDDQPNLTYHLKIGDDFFMVGPEKKQKLLNNQTFLPVIHIQDPAFSGKQIILYAGTPSSTFNEIGKITL